MTKVASRRLVSDVAVLLIGLIATAASTQNPPPATATVASLVIRLEQTKAGKTVAVRPEHVFDSGDIVRFRLTSGTKGFLYVVNHSSSGTYTPLFPAAGATTDNAIQKGAEYLVPSLGDGWFEIEGPAGFEVVYFLVSPTPIAVSSSATKVAPGVPEASLKPRCNDSIFQARGECVDDSAGPAPLARGTPLPPQITTAAPHASRDIFFTTDEDNAVTATASPTSPVVYTFRLAHR